MTITQFDFSTSKKLIQDKIIELCKMNNHLNKVTKTYEFFTSNLWNEFKVKDVDAAHSFANEYLTQLLGSLNFFIYNKGNMIYDLGDMNSKLTDEQKLNIEQIDSQQQLGMYDIDGFLIMYIGSTYGVPSPQAAASQPITNFYTGGTVNPN